MSGPHGVVVVDKPRGPTSHDVVARLRRVLGTRRVGHCGTLDPMATGVLVVAVGEGTKLVPYLTADDKKYTATMRLGVATDSLDAEGKTTEEAAVPPLTDEEVARAATSFLGTRLQTVPRVSAVKIDGKRAHEMARSGEAFEPPTREATLHQVEATLVAPNEIALSLHAAKGFYVRSFARDLAVALGTIAHLSALRRVTSGTFGIEDAVPLEEVSAERLVSLCDAAKSAMPSLDLDLAQRSDVRHGRAIAAPWAIDAPVALLHEGALIAIGRGCGESIAVARGFPEG